MQSPMTEMDIAAERLPPEMLLNIFSHLGKQDKASCAQVCKSWNTASCVRSLWKNEEARLDLDRLTEDAVQTLKERQIGRVVITGGQSGQALKMLLEGHPNLNHLEITLDSSLAFSVLVQGPDWKLSCLKTLKISYHKHSPLLQALEAFFQCADHLESLEVCGVSGPGGDGVVERFGSRLRQLKHLTLRTGTLSDNEVRFLTGVLRPSDGPPDTPALEHLVLGKPDSEAKWAGEPMTDLALLYIAQGLPSLKSLDVGICPKVRGGGLAYLGHLPHLERLSLSRCRWLNEIDFCSVTVKHLHVRLLASTCEREKYNLLNLPRCFPSLTHVTISGGEIPEEILLWLHENLRNLYEVRLSHTTRVLRKAVERHCGDHVTFRDGSIFFPDRQLSNTPDLAR